MPDITELLKKTSSKKKFERSNYRPWNFMDEIEKEKEVESHSSSKITQASATPNNFHSKNETSEGILSKGNCNDEGSKCTEFLNPERKEKQGSVNNALVYPNNETYIDKILRLVGHQKKLFDVIYDYCVSQGTLTTGPIPMDILQSNLKTSADMVRTTIKRLVLTSLVDKLRGKRGRGGFHVFSFKEDVWAAVKEYKKIIRRGPGGDFLINSMQENHEPATYIIGLPEAWGNISLVSLHAAFRAIKTKNTQFFGKSQLKTIFVSAGNKLSSEDVQISIEHFAFGLKYFHADEPYKNMTNPGAVLVAHLKNGDKWLEPKYLTSNEIAIYKIYLNIAKNIQEDAKKYFKNWVEIDKQAKFEFYRKSMRSNDYYGEKEFLEKAWNDYNKNYWPDEKRKTIKQMLCIEDDIILEKFEQLKSIDFSTSVE